jgi:hypothetical protein
MAGASQIDDAAGSASQPWVSTPYEGGRIAIEMLFVARLSRVTFGRRSTLVPGRKPDRPPFGGPTRTIFRVSYIWVGPFTMSRLEDDNAGS